MRIVARVVSALAGALLLMLTSPAAAEPGSGDCPEQDATACGRHYFELGTAAFERGDFTAAAAAFRAAIAQRPHPVIHFNLGLSLARLSKPTAAIEQLRMVLADATTDKELRARAERELRSAELALSRVTFRLADPARDRVELDGVTVSVGGQQELAIDPGPHHVRIFSGSSLVLDQDLDLAPSERVELRVGERSRRIDVVVVPDAPPAKPLVATPAPAPARPAASPRPLPPGWFYAGLGATAALTGVTIWSGIDTKRALSDYERDLPGLSQQQADERVDDGHARELRTNLLLAGSVLCATSTAVLGIWFVDLGGAGSARAALGPQRIVLSGSF